MSDVTRWARVHGAPVGSLSAGGCLFCGTMYGGAKIAGVCPPTICRYCKRRQCLYNGLGNGTCSLCLVGLLDGYKKQTCGYARCTQDAVAIAPRVSRACVAHMKQDKTHIKFEESWREVTEVGHYSLSALNPDN